MEIKLVYTLIRVNVHTYSERSLGVYPTRVRPIRIYTVSIIATKSYSARFLAFVNIWHVTIETNTVSI
jgi:hypothetical protein